MKAGGLGDVSSALPRALRAALCDVRAISVESCLGAVTRAFNVFSNRDTFMAMRKSATARNFGWAKPVLSYQQLYRRIIEGFPRQRVA